MVILNHSLEHIENTTTLIEEIYRILKPRGIVKITVPHFSNPRAHHFLHKTYWSYYSLECFTDGSKEKYYSKARFKILNRDFKLFIPKLSWFANKFPVFYEVWLSGFIPCVEITYVLEAVK